MFASDGGAASPPGGVDLWQAQRSSHPAASTAPNARRIQGPDHASRLDRDVGLWLFIDDCSVRRGGPQNWGDVVCMAAACGCAAVSGVCQPPPNALQRLTKACSRASLY